ncbi:hypothetical protein D3C80_1136680 [compost metagenome]
MEVEALQFALGDQRLHTRTVVTDLEALPGTQAEHAGANLELAEVQCPANAKA